MQQEVLYLASKFGQRYECQLPDMTDYEKEQEEEKVASEVGISELLKPMETAPCLVKVRYVSLNVTYNCKRYINPLHAAGHHSGPRSSLTCSWFNFNIRQSVN